MTELRLRNVEPAIMELLRGQAKRNGQTLEQWLKDQLHDLATMPLRQMLKDLRVSREEMGQQFGTLPDCGAGIREDREGMC